jgi:ParB family transcriptional regulator, chromosome partitioning protein
MESIGRYPDKEPPKAVTALVEQVDKDGGHVLAVYQEPVGDRWQVFVLLPRERVVPTPYQRDLSPTHSKRLTDVVRKIDRFVDPIVVVSPKPGVYWTPNGHHRLTALEKLKARLVPAILIPEAEVAYQILALNTEKAHNLKEKSLEVIRMYRGLMEEYPKSSEEDFSFQFEAPHFITLGVLYEENRRFAGGAFAPILKRVDKFLKGKLPDTIDDRKERAEKVKAADEALGKAVAELKKRGINHPYVKQFVLARTTPLNRSRKTLPSFDQTFKALVAAIKGFDLSKVRYQDVQRAATFSAPAGD